MSDLETIRAMWEEQSHAPFPPGSSGEVLQGINLIKLDAETAGCVSIFLRQQGKLTAERRKLLQECQNRLERVLPDLSGASREYFERLWRLSCLVQRYGLPKKGG